MVMHVVPFVSSGERIILCMRPADERWRYSVIPSLGAYTELSLAEYQLCSTFAVAMLYVVSWYISMV